MLTRLLSVVISASLLSGGAGAHEFWIDPERWQVESGAPLVVQLRNGEKFEGSPQVYFPNRIARFDMVTGGAATPYTGRMGDVPALEAKAPDAGLLVLVHETQPTTLTYRDWDKFVRFVEHKGHAAIAAEHVARGLPQEGFAESYSRFAKALVAVGDGAGTDAPTGMETEFVALANPYTDDVMGGMPVQLLYRGSPRADAQVEVFDRSAEGTVTVSFLTTDAEGRTLVPIARGHEYLLDSVVLRPLHDPDGPVWESLWAAMTFSVP
ncbi:DUF4198 domain-containing protein [Lutimaribacter marinistellae]|uniref:DUF4198 domain-containing protein n=1 Tax=Lutimaribacter marinistellae TaxID=1820329 RepID=A0ABV7TMG3_9RHOB